MRHMGAFTMKTVAALTLAAALLLPGVAFAGAATDAALGLGAFAVFNQIVSGTGIFARPAPAAPPVVYQPTPPPVVYQPSPPPVVYRPAPPTIVYEAPPVVYAPPPPPVVVYRSYPAYSYRTYRHHRHHDDHGWCPPGLARKGRC